MENIEDIKNDIESTKESYRKIAKRYGTNHTQISNLIKKHNWSVAHRSCKKVSKTITSVERKENEIVSSVELSAHAQDLYDRLNTNGKLVFNHLISELGNNYKPVLNYQIWLTAKDFSDYLEISDYSGNEKYTLLSPKTGQPYINPVHNLYKQKRDTLGNSLKELGLSLSTQTRLGLKFEVPGQKQQTIFDFAKGLSMEDEDLDDI